MGNSPSAPTSASTSTTTTTTISSTTTAAAASRSTGGRRSRPSPTPKQRIALPDLAPSEPIPIPAAPAHHHLRHIHSPASRPSIPKPPPQQPAAQQPQPPAQQPPQQPALAALRAQSMHIPPHSSSASSLSIRNKARNSTRPSASDIAKFRKTLIKSSIAPGLTILAPPTPSSDLPDAPLSPTPGSTSSSTAVSSAAAVALRTSPPAADLPEEDSIELVTVYIRWRDGGKEVFVSGTFDDPPWSGRTRLIQQEFPNHQLYTIAVRLTPGSYHLKFIVDGQWRNSSLLPTATDDEGNLVNYVDVRSARRLTGEGDGPVKEWGAAWWGDGSSDDEDEEQGAWTSTIPPHLQAAAQMEEAYLHAQSQIPAQQHNHHHGGRGYYPQTPIVAPQPPPIPHPPALPRHLDKLILNARPSRSANTASGSPPPSAFTPTRPSPGGAAVVTTPNGTTTRLSQYPGHPPGHSHRRARDIASDNAVPSPPPAPPNGPIPEGTVAPAGAEVAAAAAAAAGGGGSGGRRRRERWGFGPNAPVGDDNSVLPVPSHSVVNHLGTSAIRNGVLAVATTTRYKSKYITTIYYSRATPPPSSNRSH